MVVVQLTTDNREPFREYHKPEPWFGAAPEALLQGFAKLNELEVHVVSCTQQPMRSPEKLAKNIWFHSLHVPKIGWLRSGYLGCIRACRRKIRQISPAIVHGQGTERDCAISAVFSGFPNVVTIHGNMAEMARIFAAKPFTYSWLAGKLETFTLRRTNGVFCNSAYTQNLVSTRSRQTWRVPNPIREIFYSSPHPTSTHHCVLTNIGVISARKRQIELLDLATKLRKRGLDFRFDFVGMCDVATEYGREFIRKVDALGECVRYLGVLDESALIAQFDASAALVHFPMEEAFGLVVCEALARGVKFFGAGTGGIRDITADVATAELFDVRDWEGLEQAIHRWIVAGFPRSADAFGQMRERYHPSVIAQKHVDIYREVLRRPS